MKLSQRITSFVLMFAMLVALLPTSVYAKEDEKTDAVSIRVSNGSSVLTYDVIFKNGEIYFPAETYGQITNYEFTTGNGNYGYQLGAKWIIINSETGEMVIPVQHYTADIGEVIHKDGTDYLPASALLPWMNVACNVNNNILEIVPDGISLWEIVDELDYSGYMFNLYEEYGDSVSDIAGLTAMSVFDTVIHLRWDRLIPADGTITGAANGGSLYDYKCYKAALTEIAQIDPFSYEQAESVIGDVVKVNNGLDKIEEAMGLDESKKQLELDSYLRELGTDEDVVLLFYDLTETWQNLREGIKAYDQISKYLDILSILKAYELVVETDTEYREYINWLARQEIDNTLFDRALDETTKVLDENMGVLYSMYIKWGHQLLSDLPENVVSAIANNTMNDAVIEACNLYKGSIFSSLGKYMAIAQVVYGVIFPVTDGYEGMAKAGVLEAIQDYCWSLAMQLQDDELTPETITYIRQSYITALQASKKNYESKQETMDAKILGMITVFDGEGLLDYQFNKIDKKNSATYC